MNFKKKSNNIFNDYNKFGPIYIIIVKLEPSSLARLASTMMNKPTIKFQLMIQVNRR